MENTPRTVRGGGGDKGKQLSELSTKAAAIDRALVSNRHNQDSVTAMLHAERGVTQAVYDSNMIVLLSEEADLLDRRRSIEAEIKKMQENQGMPAKIRLGRFVAKLRGEN